LYSSRANELEEARDHAVSERKDAVERATALADKQKARDAADTRAWEVYQLLEQGKRAEATKLLDAALRELPLSRTERTILAARAHETRVMEIDAALKAATASFKAGRYGDVIAPLEAALAGEPNGSRAASMRYFLGIAHAKAGTLDKAVAYLQAAVEAEVEHDDARFQLASALDRNGNFAKARAEYDRFATQFPQSQFAVYAMRRSATLARMPPSGPPLPAPAPDAAPVQTPVAPIQKPVAPVPRPLPKPEPKPEAPVEPAADGSAAP
jgi:tetratricopeptide (TPR) repeat protein